MASNTFQRGAVKVSSGGDADTPAASEGHDALRVWLRTMAIYKLVYREVHGRLRESFGITLARFDLSPTLRIIPTDFGWARSPTA
jgi:hypothetical protein